MLFHCPLLLQAALASPLSSLGEVPSVLIGAAELENVSISTTPLPDSTGRGTPACGPLITVQTQKLQMAASDIAKAHSCISAVHLQGSEGAGFGQDGAELTQGSKAAGCKLGSHPAIVPTP